VYFVILLNRTCFGKLNNKTAYYPVVTIAEKIPAYILVVVIIWLGIQPTWLVKWSEATSTAVVATIQPVQNQTIANAELR
jgi:NAD(P)H-quinone oxidoreductase subunit 4